MYVGFSCNVQIKWGMMKATSLAVWLRNRKLGEGLGTRLMLDQIAEVIEAAGGKVVISEECLTIDCKPLYVMEVFGLTISTSSFHIAKICYKNF